MKERPEAEADVMWHHAKRECRAEIAAHKTFQHHHCEAADACRALDSGGSLDTEFPEAGIDWFFCQLETYHEARLSDGGIALGSRAFGGFREGFLMPALSRGSHRH